MELTLKGFALAPPQMIERLEEDQDDCMKYLVDVGGELFLVLRYTDIGYRRLPDIDDFYLTYDFEVYKLDFPTKVWKLVKSLGYYCLFIGTDNAFAVPVSSVHPFTVHGDNGISLRPNCIYFLDNNAFDKKSDGFDMGVFHVGERLFGVRPLGENVEVLFCNRHVTPQPIMLKTLASGLYSPSSPPLWITPCIRFQGDKVKNSRTEITPEDEDEDEDEDRHKLIFQLKNQFTYREGHGVDRKYQARLKLLNF